MYILLFSVATVVCLVAAWKRSVTSHLRDMHELRSELRESLDFETNELKQQYVKTIDEIFADYYEKKNI
eukprot:SAG31_NODE_3425_length_4290_cov_171.943927_6_plen_69_part_00